MQFLLFVAVLVSVVLVSRVIPDLRFPARESLTWEAILFFIVLMAISLGWVWWIERRAERVTGHTISFARRTLIPVPVYLVLATIVKAIVMPFGGYGTDGEVVFYQYAALSAVAILPFLLIEEKPAPLRLIFSVWGGYALWAIAMLLAWKWALR